MVAGHDKAVLHTAFSGWFGAAAKSKAEADMRQKYEDELARAEAKLSAFKEQKLRSVRGALMRRALESDELLLHQVVKEWAQAMTDSKKQDNFAEQLEQAQGKLAQLRVEHASTAQKVVCRLSAGSDSGASRAAFLTWAHAVEEVKRECDLQAEARRAELRVKEHMQSRKVGAASILERLTVFNDTSLLSRVLANWSQATQEECRTRELSHALGQAKSKLNSLEKRRMDSACSVQDRLNEQVAFFLCMRVLSAWLLTTKAELLSRHFFSKLENKRRQLSGVQNLFKTFAMQLEQGLGGVEDGEETSRGTTSRQHFGHQQLRGSRAVPGDASSRGMHRAEASLSLPDIHSRPRVA